MAINHLHKPEPKAFLMRKLHVQQHDQADCAAACLAMICASHGKSVSISDLRDAMGTDIRGTSLKGLIQGATQLGFDVKPVRLSQAHLRTNFTMPAIAQLANMDGTFHFVVLHRIGKNQITMSDPTSAKPTKTSFEAFATTFTGVVILLTPAATFAAQSKRKSSTAQKFVEIIRPQKGLFAWAILSSLILTVLGIAGSLITRILFDEVIPHRLSSLLTSVLILFLIMTVVQHLVQFVRQWIVLHLSQRIDLPLILGYFRHVYSLPMSFFATRSVGDILTRFGDALTIKSVFAGAALTVVMDVVMAFVTGIVLFSMNKMLFLLIAVFIVLSLSLMLIYKRPFRKTNQAQMEQASVLNSRIIDGLRGVSGIKFEANETREMEGVEREYVRSLRLSYKEGMLANGQSTLASLLQAIVGLVTLTLGTSLIVEGTLTLGGLMAFVALSGFFVDPVSRLIGLQLEWQEANLALKRVGEIFDHKGEDADSMDEVALDGSGSLDFHEVSFRYNSRNLVLNNVSFSAAAGSKIAFVGPSGSGKSTIAKLILRMYEPESGHIALCGVKSRELSPGQVRRAVGFVPQAVQLYSRSIADNVRISTPDATDSQVRKVLTLADAEGFVSQLPNQMNTILEESGAGLSGGEKRRIGLARALLKQSALYVFDELTSDLDSITEAQLVDGVFEHLNASTVIFIAHRLASIARCDLIHVLDKGQIVETGTHEQLLEMNGMYSKMWAAQQSISARAWPTGEAISYLDPKPLNSELEEEMTYGGPTTSG